MTSRGSLCFAGSASGGGPQLAGAALGSDQGGTHLPPASAGPPAAAFGGAGGDAQGSYGALPAGCGGAWGIVGCALYPGGALIGGDVPVRFGVGIGPPGGAALGNAAPGGSAFVGTGVAIAGAAPEQVCTGGGTCDADGAAAGAAPEQVCTGGGPLAGADGSTLGAAPEQVCTGGGNGGCSCGGPGGAIFGGGPIVGGGALPVVASRLSSNSFPQTTQRPMCGPGGVYTKRQTEHRYTVLDGGTTCCLAPAHFCGTAGKAASASTGIASDGPPGGGCFLATVGGAFFLSGWGTPCFGGTDGGPVPGGGGFASRNPLVKPGDHGWSLGCAGGRSAVGDTGSDRPPGSFPEKKFPSPYIGVGCSCGPMFLGMVSTTGSRTCIAGDLAYASKMGATLACCTTYGMLKLW